MYALKKSPKSGVRLHKNIPVFPVGELVKHIYLVEFTL